ncbi:MAG: hypothetical protein A4E65_03395 [Syntrophorhabdus sp. PtaU1.Bin153]|nr:MAG: hypothetical protein A4E65_03395 [Syntrophorhabdus sp. PtaU1.Bin153]
MRRSLAATATAVLTVLVVLSLLFGCTYVSVETRKYLAVPSYPPTNPTTVQILHSEPTTPHKRLGEISLEPQGNPTVPEMEAKLRQAAADMGADAAVIVADTTKLMGSYVSGPWWGRQVSPIYGRVIVAVAIKYIQ